MRARLLSEVLLQKHREGRLPREQLLDYHYKRRYPLRFRLRKRLAGVIERTVRVGPCTLFALPFAAMMLVPVLVVLPFAALLVSGLTLRDRAVMVLSPVIAPLLAPVVVVALTLATLRDWLLLPTHWAVARHRRRKHRAIAAELGL